MSGASRAAATRRKLSRAFASCRTKVRSRRRCFRWTECARRRSARSMAGRCAARTRRRYGSCWKTSRPPVVLSPAGRAPTARDPNSSGGLVAGGWTQSLENSRLYEPAPRATSLRSAPLVCILPIVEFNVVAMHGAGVELARAADAAVRVRDHFAPVGHPAYRSRNREHHREHRHRNAERAINDAGVEVDVRVQVLLDEVVIAQCHTL